MELPPIELKTKSNQLVSGGIVEKTVEIIETENKST